MIAKTYLLLFTLWPPMALFLLAHDLEPSLRWFSSLGVGGALAGIIFYFYRMDRKRSEDGLREVATSFRSIVQENTTALNRLCNLLDK